MKRAPTGPRLPSPGVSFAPDFLARLGRLVERMESARERVEGAGRSSLFGAGAEFVEFRPYRPGEDLRALDLGLFVRLRRPFVRVARREASEHWVVLLDSSASMGVGVPGKLQAAAELATGIAALGARRGARVDLWTSARARSFHLRRAAQVPAWMRFLEEELAAGERGLAALAREARHARAGRVFALGDFLDLAPGELLGVAGRGSELSLGQVLARDELVPEPATARGARGVTAVAWVDAETGERLRMALDAPARAEYQLRLGARLEAWREAAARRRAQYGCWTSAEPFERALEGWFRA